MYRNLGPERTIRLAYRTGTKHANADQVSGRWSQWAKRHEWEDRARAYDAHLEKVELQAREREIAKRASEIERRRQQAQDEAWAIYEELKTKVQQMLKLPIVTVTDADGKKTVNPAKWDYNSLARAIEAMTKLMKLGAGLDSGLVTNLNIDWESLTEEQLERIAAGEDPALVIGSARKGCA